MKIHDVEVIAEFLSEGWFAVCSCGWESESCARHVEAILAADEHRDAVGWNR